MKDLTTEESREQTRLERECIHRQAGAEGDLYRGAQFVRALQRMRGEAALAVARKVGAFFWSDAPRVSVWLCRDCAAEAALPRPGLPEPDAT